MLANTLVAKKRPHSLKNREILKTKNNFLKCPTMTDFDGHHACQLEL